MLRSAGSFFHNQLRQNEYELFANVGRKGVVMQAYSGREPDRVSQNAWIVGTVPGGLVSEELTGRHGSRRNGVTLSPCRRGSLFLVSDLVVY